MVKKLLRFGRWVGFLGLFWICIVGGSSVSEIRDILAKPLVVSNENARGDLCYVLADGNATWERLSAAADLYNMGRVPRIYILKDTMTGRYNFVAKSSWTLEQWEISYLGWLGVPSDKVTLLPVPSGFFGTLAEARDMARNLPQGTGSIVIVSSAPHMRRSLLAFRRSLPANVKVLPYAATSYVDSYEMALPIWLEYLKLVVYYVIA